MEWREARRFEGDAVGNLVVAGDGGVIAREREREREPG